MAEFGKASPPHLGIYQSNSLIIYWDLGVQVCDILDALDMIKHYPDWIEVCYVCRCFMYSLLYILRHHLFVYDLAIVLPSRWWVCCALSSGFLPQPANIGSHW